MEKGKLIKNLDLTKYKYPYIARRSYGSSIWYVEAYKRQFDKGTGFVGKITVHVAGKLQASKINNGFPNILQAFLWAENQIDYKHEVFKEVYIKMLMKGERQHFNYFDRIV